MPVEFVVDVPSVPAVIERMPPDIAAPVEKKEPAPKPGNKREIKKSDKRITKKANEKRHEKTPIPLLKILPLNAKRPEAKKIRIW